MSVEVQIRKQADHLAAYRIALLAAVASRGSLWSMVDDASDETYENRVRGSLMTATDSNLNSVNVSPNLGDWFRLHNEYFASDSPINGVNSLAGAIAYYRWRVSYHFREYMKAVLGVANAVSLDYTFPSQSISLGTWTSSGASTGTFTDGSALDETVSGAGIIRSTVTHAIGGSNNLVLNVTAKFEDDTTVVVSHTIASNTALNTVTLLGGQAVTGSLTGGSSTTITLAATGQFKAGNHALLVEGSTTELITISTVNAGVSVVASAAVKNSFTTSALLYPLFKDITTVSASNGNSSDAVAFTFAPDRSMSTAYP